MKLCWMLNAATEPNYTTLVGSGYFPVGRATECAWLTSTNFATETQVGCFPIYVAGHESHQFTDIPALSAALNALGLEDLFQAGLAAIDMINIDLVAGETKYDWFARVIVPDVIARQQATGYTINGVANVTIPGDGTGYGLAISPERAEIAPFFMQTGEMTYFTDYWIGNYGGTLRQAQDKWFEYWKIIYTAHINEWNRVLPGAWKLLYNIVPGNYLSFVGSTADLVDTEAATYYGVPGMTRMQCSQRVNDDLVWLWTKPKVALWVSLYRNQHRLIDDTATPQQATNFGVTGGSGTFLSGETVTGGTSGKTGTYSNERDGRMYLYAVSGLFTNGETVTGGTSGATKVLNTVSSPLVQCEYGRTFGNNATRDTAWLAEQKRCADMADPPCPIVGMFQSTYTYGTTEGIGVGLRPISMCDYASGLAALAQVGASMVGIWDQFQSYAGNIDGVTYAQYLANGQTGIERFNKESRKWITPAANNLIALGGTPW